MKTLLNAQTWLLSPFNLGGVLSSLLIIYFIAWAILPPPSELTYPQGARLNEAFPRAPIFHTNYLP